jgi:hypothetical protein
MNKKSPMPNAEQSQDVRSFVGIPLAKWLGGVVAYVVGVFGHKQPHLSVMRNDPFTYHTDAVFELRDLLASTDVMNQRDNQD